MAQLHKKRKIILIDLGEIFNLVPICHRVIGIHAPDGGRMRQSRKRKVIKGRLHRIRVEQT
jgi:hypothetical protein